MRIDIVMPFYGDPEQLTIAVDSVLAQDDVDFRLIVLDDHYPDATVSERLRALPDPRLTVVRNERNLGVSGSFARAIELAEAPYLNIMGCDDVMLPGYIGRVRTLLKRAESDVVQPGVRVIDERGVVQRPLADRIKARSMPRGPRPMLLRGESLAASLLRANWCYFPSITWRTAALREHGFRSDLRMVQDLALLLSIVRAGGSLMLDDEVVFEYRRHAASVSMVGVARGSRFNEERALFAEERARMEQLGWHRAARAARVHLTSRLNALSGAPRALLDRDLPAARVLARHALGPAVRGASAARDL
jgi:glycosyltransferase involved in cell wall biosynthesis